MNNIVKSFSITNDIAGGIVNLKELCDQIIIAGVIVNFDGLNRNIDNIDVLGDSILDEVSLDAVFSNHVPI